MTTINARCHIEAEEFVAINKFIVLRRNPRYVRRQLILSAIVLLCGVFAVRDHATYAYALVAAAFMVPVFSYFQCTRAVEKLPERLPGAIGDVEWTISDEGIESVVTYPGGVNRSSSNWSLFERSEDAGPFYLLRGSSSQRLSRFVLKRAFASESDEQDFVELLNRHTQFRVSARHAPVTK